MAGKEKIEYSLELDVRNWQRGIAAAISDVRSLEQSLDRAAKSINDFESALKINSDFKVDVSITGIDEAIDQKQKLEGNVTFNADVIDTSINDAIRRHDDLNENTTFNANVNDTELNVADSIHDSLDENVSFNAGVEDAELNAAKRKHDDLDENTTFIVNVNEGTMPESIQKLLAANAAVDLAVNITGMAGGAAGGALDLFGFVTDPLIQADTAVQRFEARTGQSIENMNEMITNVWAGGWGDSQEEIGNIMTKLVSDLNAPADELEHLTALALDTADVMGADWTEVLSAAAAMVDSGFAPSLESAFDGMVKGQQEGLNRAGDLLDTFREYSTTFNDMGFSMDDALSTMNAGLEAGIDNTDRIADAIREAGIRATTDFATKQPFFEQIGFTDEAQAFAAGDITGKQYMDGLFEALSKVEDQSVRELIQDELLGTISEDFGADALAALGDIQEQIRMIGTESQTASDTINNTMGVAWTTIKRTFQAEVADYFNNELDFTGFIDRLKTSVSGFFSDLKSGEGFGDSLSINLGMALDETAFGDIIQTLVDALLSVGEGIASAALSILEAINSLPFGDVSTASAENILGDIRSFRFNFDLANIDEMDMNEFTTFLNEATEKGIEDMTPRLRDAFQRSLDDSTDGLETAGLISKLKLTQSYYTSEDFRPLFDPIIQDAASQATDAMNEAFSSNDLSKSLNIAEMLFGSGEGSQAQVDIIRSSIRLNLGQLLQGAFQPSDLERLPNIWDDYLSVATPDEATDATLGRIGMELDELFRTAISKGDLNLMETIIGTGDELGIDTSFWQETLQTEQLREETEAAQESLRMVGEDGSESLGLIGAASTTLDIDFKNATGNMTLNYSKMTSQMQTDSALIEEAFGVIGTAWNLLPESLRGALVGGFANLPQAGLPSGGGGNTTTINQSNTFNNQTPAASSASGQAAANSIRIAQ